MALSGPPYSKDPPLCFDNLTNNTGQLNHGHLDLIN